MKGVGVGTGVALGLEEGLGIPAPSAGGEAESFRRPGRFSQPVNKPRLNAIDGAMIRVALLLILIVPLSMLRCVSR